MERIVALVDMDCFYVQVEQRLNPSLKGKPCVVVQYKTWKGGGIIAVGYEARAFGVTRNMWGDDAKKKCPDVQLVRVPEVRGKADLTKYREAGAEVIAVLSKFSQCVERASIDEAYIDLTEEVEQRMQSMDKIDIDSLQNTFIVGFDKEHQQLSKDEKRKEGVKNWLDCVNDSDNCNVYDHRLAVGAVIAEEMRAAVYEETGFRCSAGIAHNKMLAKLICGFNKPNKQTVLPHGSVPELFKTLPVNKIRNLGGKLGQSIVEQLGVEFIGDLCKYTEQELQHNFGDKTGAWLFEVCQGIEHEPVNARQLPKSIGCSKNFPGKTKLDTREKVKYWLSELAGEVEERLLKDREMNKRVAKTLTVNVRYLSYPSPVVASRACALVRYEAKKFTDDAFALLQKFNTLPPYQAAWSPEIVCLGLSASKFSDESSKGMGNISVYLGNKVITNSQSAEAEQGNKRSRDKTSAAKGSISSFFKKKDSPDADGETSNNIENAFQQTDEEDTVHTDDSENSSSVNGGIASFFSKKVENLKEQSIYNFEIEQNLIKNIQLKKEKNKRGSIEHFLQNGIIDDKYAKAEEKLETSSFQNSESSEVKTCGSAGKKKGFFAARTSTSKLPTNAHVSLSSVVDISNSDSNDSKNFHMHLDVFDIDSLDKDVFESLPADIKEEILAGLNRNHKNTVSKPKGMMEKFVEKAPPVDQEKLDEESNFLVEKKRYSHVENENCNESVSETNFGEGVASNFSNNQTCQKCGKEIASWEMSEHLDFHFAQDLQKEWRTNDLLERTNSAVSTNKRKLDSSTSKNFSKRHKTKDNSKTLESFFVKK